MEPEEQPEEINETVETTPSVLASIKGYVARFRTVPKRPMSEAGYETATASDGPEALEAAKKFDPVDVLLTDVMMPQMAGDELARRLRQSEPSLKVLYLTGFSDRLFKERVTLWEDEAFLDKPCSVKGLVQAVSLLASGRLD